MNIDKQIKAFEDAIKSVDDAREAFEQAKINLELAKGYAVDMCIEHGFSVALTANTNLMRKYVGYNK